MKVRKNYRLSSDSVQKLERIQKFYQQQKDTALLLKSEKVSETEALEYAIFLAYQTLSKEGYNL